jgi:hypothetical protein
MDLVPILDDATPVHTDTVGYWHFGYHLSEATFDLATNM